MQAKTSMETCVSEIRQALEYIHGVEQADTCPEMARLNELEDKFWKAVRIAPL